LSAFSQRLAWKPRTSEQGEGFRENEGEAGKKLNSERHCRLFLSGWRGSLGHPSKAKDSEKFLKIRALLVFEKNSRYSFAIALNTRGVHDGASSISVITLAILFCDSVQFIMVFRV